ncbi:hypothetical protein CAEBREN_00967 [Caenorhabditis brenneri]|uniref:Secreted protein n=1 Tax=Caenorhabditis brenneri TaxID=135651 RepID=G0P8B0_CAEBE|nr:hypothetical protein CAEBREN_00967 [Caenorhabditis brenneri]
MHLWHLFLLLVLFIASTFGAELEGSGSGDAIDEVSEEAVLKAQNLLNAVPSEGSGTEGEASGEDVQTFFF